MKTTLNLFAAVLLLASAVSALADVHYVDVNSTNATPPYTNWITAATNIQDAVDAAEAGDEIVVTNGTYYPVSVPKPLSVRSVNGSQLTIIDGGGGVRCATLSSGASLSGFALRNGYASEGGGAYGGTLNNCTLNDNLAYPDQDDASTYGGGAYNCNLNNCTLAGNSAYTSFLSFASYAYGGGAYDCTLNNCTLTDNSANSDPNGFTTANGGGAYRCTLNNCSLTRNSASVGGGAYHCTLNNCTLRGNRADDREFGRGTGAVRDCIANNCIRFVNSFFVDNLTGYICEDCASPGLLAGNNWIGDPLFASGLRLQSDSPCINAGNNSYVTNATDRDGNPRIVGGTVDIGAYEYQSLSLMKFGVVSNQFGFTVTGQSNWVVVFEASSDFTNWTSLTTNTLRGSPSPFSDSTPPNLPQCFYRARQELP